MEEGLKRSQSGSSSQETCEGVENGEKGVASGLREGTGGAGGGSPSCGYTVVHGKWSLVGNGAEEVGGMDSGLTIPPNEWTFFSAHVKLLKDMNLDAFQFSIF
jgi:hypothetical protein